MKEFWEFVKETLRPRAIKWWWRLGEFECVCWSHDYWIIREAARKERRQALHDLINAEVRL